MAKGKGALSSTVNFVAWLTGVLVSLAVGFGMASGTLTLPIWLGGATLAVLAGWIVIILTLVSVVLAIINKVR